MAFTGIQRRLPPLGLFVGLSVVVVLGFAVATFNEWRNDIALSERGAETSARVVTVGDGKNNGYASSSARRTDGESRR